MLNQGCTLCYQGAKMVLFLTGKCNRSCWYCPISDERQGKDIVWANDRIVTSDADLIEEAENMSALGTGVTGGEVFLKPEKLVHYCSLLKEHFGPDHHSPPLFLLRGTPQKSKKLDRGRDIPQIRDIGKTSLPLTKDRSNKDRQGRILGSADSHFSIQGITAIYNKLIHKRCLNILE